MSSSRDIVSVGDVIAIDAMVDIGGGPFIGGMAGGGGVGHAISAVTGMVV